MLAGYAFHKPEYKCPSLILDYSLLADGSVEIFSRLVSIFSDIRPCSSQYAERLPWCWICVSIQPATYRLRFSAEIQTAGVLAQRLIYRDRAPQTLPEDQQRMGGFGDEEDQHVLHESYGDADPEQSSPQRPA